MKTRVLSESLTEETVYLLAEWLVSVPVHGSIAFPEIVVSIVVLLRKSLKHSKTASSKEQNLVKVLLERVDNSVRWMEERRKAVQFAPSRIGDVQEWEKNIRSKLVDDTPLGKYVKVQRKTREKRRKLIEKVRLVEPPCL
jgi:nucleolar complex protein 2